MKHQLISFIIFSTLIILSALKVILSNNLITSALFLLITFATMSGIWILLKTEFLALALIIIYIGSVMILFLFIIIMTNLNKNKTKKITFKNFFLISIISIITALKILNIFFLDNFKIKNLYNNNFINIKKLSILIYTKYIYAFEISSLILMISIIAVISITLNKEKNIKNKNTN